MAVFSARIRRTLAAMFALAALSGAVRGGTQQGEGREVVVLRQGEGLDELIDRLDKPADRGGDEADAGAAALDAGVTSVEVAGTVDERGDQARLTITLELWARGPGPHRVPIGLDGLYPREATDGDGDRLAWEAGEAGRWWLVLPGPTDGDRTAVVEVVAPVRTVDERLAMAVAIHPAARTSLRLELPGPAAEAALDGGRALLPLAEGGTRIEAELTPRPEIALSWLPLRDPEDRGGPLLTASGDLAMDVEAGVITTRSTWVVQARRGESEALELRLDPAEEVVEAEVDGRAVLPVAADGGRGGLRLPLAAPLRAGGSARVALSTLRRPEPDASGRSTLTVTGHPFAGMIGQRGTLSIARPDGLRVVAEPRRGLRRIDPRELREELTRARPTIVSAFRFDDQPFDLDLAVEPMPPLLRVEQRSLILVDDSRERATVTSWLDVRSARGQVFELRAAVPDGLEVLQVGPSSAVTSWAIEPDGTKADGTGTLVIVPASPIREGHPPLRIELSGRVDRSIATGETAAIPLFRPLDAAFDDGRVAVAAPAELVVRPADPEAADPAVTEPATEAGPWGAVADGPARLALWFRCAEATAAVRLAMADREPTVLREVELLARVGRDGLAAQQDVTLHVREGDLRSVVLVVPAALQPDRWELADRGAVEDVELLDADPDGTTRHRVRLAPAAAGEPIRLRFNLDPPGPRSLEPGEPVTLELPRITVLAPGPSLAPRVEVAAEPGLDLNGEGDDWRSPAEPTWVTDPVGDAPLPIRLIWSGPAVPDGDGEDAAAEGPPPRITVVAARPADLPATLAARLYLRTEEAPEGAVQVAAWFRLESFGPSLTVGLPAPAELERVTVDGRPLPGVDVEAAAEAGSYRLTMPAEAAAGAVLGLTYRVPAEAGSARWSPPVLDDDGRVLATLWEVRLPWSRALVGVPDGYSDENQWYWGGYVWKRRPWMAVEELADWVLGDDAGIAERLGTMTVEGRLGDHGYLFGRPGGPLPLRPTVVSRALLVGVCSGAVLLLGLVMLARSAFVRSLVPAVAVATAAGLALVERSAAILAIQAGAVGALLVLVAGLTRRLVERRRPGPRYAEPAGLSATGSSGSAAGDGDAPALVGSDDSTAIRPRPRPLDEPTPDAPDDVIDIPAPRGAGREAS